MSGEGHKYLALENISFSYDAHRVIFKEFSLAIQKGTAMLVTGPVGAGKTTLARLICGDLRPKSGKILLKGTGIVRAPRARRADILAHWGVLLEDTYLLDNQSVADNVRLALSLSSARKSSESRTVESVLRQSGIWGNRNQNPSALSKGQRKLLQLAMVDARNPEFILWDDPESNLDERSLRTAIERIKRNHRAGCTLLILTSHPEYFSELAAEVIPIPEQST